MYFKLLTGLLMSSLTMHAHDDFMSPIATAAAKGNLEEVKTLLVQSSDQSKSGSYALLAACYEGKLEVVKYLIEQGVTNQSTEDLHGMNSAYDIAYENGHWTIVEYLRTQGQCPDWDANNLK